MCQEQKKQIYMWPSHWEKPAAHGDYGAVSCNNSYAARAGLWILKNGGNAFDAAAAVSLALSVVEPHHSGIGGGCFSLLYSEKEGRIFALDGRGTAPVQAGPDLFLKNGEVQDEWKDLGGQSVAIPGLLKTMEDMLKRFGTMTLKEVSVPAIRYAKEGFGTSYTGALTMYDDSVKRKMRISEGFRKLYLKNGQEFYRFGDIQRNPELGVLLETIAENGTDVFYRGEIAQRIVSVINSRGGCFETADLENYAPKYREPVHTDYRGYEVVSFAPPSGGCTLIEMLNILEQNDLRAMGHNTADSIHAIAEAMKLGFADRSIALGDPDFVSVDTERLTSKAYAAKRFRLIGGHAGEYAPAEGIEAKRYRGTPPHFSIMDRFGNAVSQTQTVRDWFGSGIAVEGLGFVLNNAMSDFSAAAGAMTSQGLAYGNANSIAGGKTPLSSMSPSIVLKDKKPYLAIGSAGGPRIITGTLQGIINAIDFDMNPEQLVNAPYVNCLTREQGLEAEFGISQDTLRLLEERGHKPVCIEADQAMSTMVNSVMLKDGEYYAAGTKRVDGCGGVLLSNGNIILEGISQEIS